jgi:benzoyl-CoA reductase/2-hydroxyglutaryl-CoA dehydratase subunit BcrC/BadD/HgdB
MFNERIEAKLREIPKRLVSAKERGTRIVGYFPGGYVPEELIVASGAIPVCLIDGADNIAVEASLRLMPRFFCPFSRAQIGEKLLKRNLYYSLLDMLVAPITCQHLKKVAELWEYQGDIEIFKLGIPHQCINEFEVEYYANRLKLLKDKLQELTGNTITDNTINDAIAQYNKIRGLFRQMSLLRRNTITPITSLDFVKLNHMSFYADPKFTIEILEEVLFDINKMIPQKDSNAPRLLITGPNICNGDYKLLELIDNVGGNIVVEEIFEGVRTYWRDITIGRDPIESLVQGYLIDRIPPAFMRDSAKKRLDHIIKLISEFNVSGVIWYELRYCETFDSESFYFAQKLKENDIPFLIIESDYDKSYIGQIETRIQAFTEMIRLWKK